jgi:hypothetical protein
MKVNSSQKPEDKGHSDEQKPRIRGYERMKKREITGIEEAVGNKAAVSRRCMR